MPVFQPPSLALFAQANLRYYRPQIIHQINNRGQRPTSNPEQPRATPVLTSVSGKRYRILLLVAAAIWLGACVYRVDVQQGNLLEQDEIDGVKVGMTRNQVRFLLGTPVAQGVFHSDRWDYIYFFKQGRSRKVDRRWLIVYFDDDLVREIQRDVPVKPT